MVFSRSYTRFFTANGREQTLIHIVFQDLEAGRSGGLHLFQPLEKPVASMQ